MVRNEPVTERAWRVIEQRASAPWFYGVMTTGVYCRAGCPSRRPLRRNTRVFVSPAAARAAGLRPCLRCRPDEGVKAIAVPPWIPAACERLRDAERPTPMLSELGRAAGLSPWQVQRQFKRAMGVSPRQYAQAARLEAARRSLRRESNVTDALYAVGYSGPSRLYENAGARLGMTPGAYRDGGRGEDIAWIQQPTRLGRLLVAATARGVCWAQFDAGRTDLAGHFPAARIVDQPNPRLRQWARALGAAIDQGRSPANLPLDLQGTAFQARVWEAIRRIPAGESQSYTTLAKQCGTPRGARAVARACASNPVAIAVPCHRVVRGDGGMGGYRWGLERKEKLLAAEQRAANLSR